MPRRARLTIANVPLHLIQRGNNRQPCFFSDNDYRIYLSWLAMYASTTGCRIHAYALMTNHVRLLVSGAEARSVSQMMKALGQRYVQHVNRVYARTGTLWDGRFHSCITQEERYFLICQRYIELNPVRACMVEHPAQYRWSSYRSNADGEASVLISPHSLYLRLGIDPMGRQSAYRALFNTALSAGQIETIRWATNGNFTLGDEAFAAEIANILGCRTAPTQDQLNVAKKAWSDPGVTE